MPNLDGEDYHSSASVPLFARGGDTYEELYSRETREVSVPVDQDVEAQDVDELLAHAENDVHICLAALPLQTGIAEESRVSISL